MFALNKKTMMGDQNVITDTKAKTTVLLMNMMGKKNGNHND